MSVDDDYDINGVCVMYLLINAVMKIDKERLRALASKTVVSWPETSPLLEETSENNSK